MIKESLYDKYGGFETISKIVHGLYEKIATSDILQPYFEGVDLQSLMNHQTLFFSAIMGGPVSYDNQRLYSVHSRLNISDEAFSEVAELLEEVLEDFGVSADDTNFILNLVTEVKPQIVQA